MLWLTERDARALVEWQNAMQMVDTFTHIRNADHWWTRGRWQSVKSPLPDLSSSNLEVQSLDAYVPPVQRSPLRRSFCQTLLGIEVIDWWYFLLRLKRISLLFTIISYCYFSFWLVQLCRRLELFGGFPFNLFHLNRSLATDTNLLQVWV